MNLFKKTKRKHYAFTTAVIFALCLVTTQLSAVKSSASDEGSSTITGRKKTGAPIHIKSDSMEAMDKNGTVVFKGNVVAIRGDLTINADRLMVVYSDLPARGDSDKKRRVLRKIVATGHVKIIQGKKVGTGREAIYDKRGEKLILTGDAQVWEGSNRITGTKITLYINENRSVVESSDSQKVEATVYTD